MGSPRGTRRKREDGPASPPPVKRRATDEEVDEFFAIIGRLRASRRARYKEWQPAFSLEDFKVEEKPKADRNRPLDLNVEPEPDRGVAG